MADPTASDIATSRTPAGASQPATVQQELDRLDRDRQSLAARIHPRATPRTTDPRLTASIETDASTVAVATPTTGPQRLTFVVPFHQTLVSLGQAGDAATRIDDFGITGRTDKHVHWHVSNGVNTVVSLGSSATTANVTANDAKVPTQSSGYAMVTDGKSWQDSGGQHSIVARSGDVVVRVADGSSAVLQSDGGHVEVNGAHIASVKAADLVSISAKAFTPHAHKYGELWPQAGIDGAIKFDQKTVAKVLDMAQATYGVITGALKVKKAIKPGESGWVTEAVWGTAKALVDGAKLIGTINRFFDTATPGQVKIAGDSDVSLSGSRAASVFGSMSASMTSTVSASVLGGTAGMKGLLYSSIWAGLEAGMKGLVRVSVEAEKGKASFKGKSKVEVSCSDGPLNMQGSESAQVSGSAGWGAFHGKTSVFCGAGDSSGFGMGAHSSAGVQIGKISSNAGKFKQGAQFDANNVLTFTDNNILMKKNESEITLRSNHLNIGHGDNKAQFTSSQVILDGTKLLLG